MESKEDLNSFLEINDETFLKQFLAQSITDFNFDLSQKTNSILEDLDESKIMDEFINKNKVFENSKEQWKSFIRMVSSKYGNSKDELERISKMKIDVQALIEFLPKFQISLVNYESTLLLNEKHEVYQKLFNQIEFIQKAIDNGASQIYLKKIFNDSVDKVYIEIDEYDKNLSAFKLTNSKIEEQLINSDNNFKETIEMIDEFIVKMKKEKEKREEFKRFENIRIEKLNQMIQKPLKVIKTLEIEEFGNREPYLEMDTHEELGYTAKSYFSNRNGEQNLYIILLENISGKKIQEIIIKEFNNGSCLRCKWSNTKEIGELKLVVFTLLENFGLIFELDKNSKKLKENYKKLEIENNYNRQMSYSEKFAIINHGNFKGITVFDSITHQKIENVKGSNWVIVGQFYDDNKYIYADDNNRIFHYNLETKKQKIVNGNHPKNNICAMKISNESNTLILGHYKNNIYIYKLNLGNTKFASFQKLISGISNKIFRMEFISLDKLMIAVDKEKNFRIVDIKSEIIEEKEIIKGNQLTIYDFKFDEKNGVIVVLASDYDYPNTKSQIHFLS